MSAVVHRSIRGVLQQLTRSKARLLEPAAHRMPRILSASLSSSTAGGRARRRKRPKAESFKLEALQSNFGLEEPFAYGDGESSEEYFKKTSLSPWVPVPDPVARKLFDLTSAGPEDIHVDLGCGDGRVNFFALDHGRVQKSTGVDIDENILKVATDRLSRRHPQPPIEFVKADLLDRNDPVWEKTIPEATIITMYFVEDALQKIRPILEATLVGKPCKIITCGYEMKGWSHTVMETTLGMTVFLYEWGSVDEDGESLIFRGDEIISEQPRGLTMDDPNLAQAIKSGKVKHNYTRFLRGFDPTDKIDDVWDDFGDSDDDDEEDDGESNSEAKELEETTLNETNPPKGTPCSRK